MIPATIGIQTSFSGGFQRVRSPKSGKGIAFFVKTALAARRLSHTITEADTIMIAGKIFIINAMICEALSLISLACSEEGSIWV
jgi:hypothetical protein